MVQILIIKSGVLRWFQYQDYKNNSIFLLPINLKFKRKKNLDRNDLKVLDDIIFDD